jgi:hypothetical protein
MAGSLPQRSRSQGRPSGAAAAGVPLDGSESEGNPRPALGSERLSLINARVGVFLVVLFHRAIHGRKHPSTTQEHYALF